MYEDHAIIARIIELVPLYDPETMPQQASTLPSGSDLGYTFINFAIDHLQDDFPNIEQEQFDRCYLLAFQQTNEWQDLSLTGRKH